MIKIEDFLKRIAEALERIETILKEHTISVQIENDELKVWIDNDP